MGLGFDDFFYVVVSSAFFPLRILSYVGGLDVALSLGRRCEAFVVLSRAEQHPPVYGGFSFADERSIGSRKGPTS